MFSRMRNAPYIGEERTARLCARQSCVETVMPVTLRDELREVLWLASAVGGLSALGVVLAVAVAVTGSI